ncbi:MAG: DoxX family membrane protein [FCB group bacterium]|nr:DoxX family membrane protein [FCB group bacterium]
MIDKVLKSNLILLFRIIIGGVLIYASITKIADPAVFARDIGNYHFLPFGLENLMALILPWVELLAGIGLILGVMVDGSALLSMGMMAVFIIAIAQAILRGYDIECGCGLKEGQMVGLDKLIEDTVYFILSWLIYKRSNRRFELYPKF